MKLNQFTLTDDHLGLHHKDKQYDLSRAFSFHGLEYDVINQELNLKWINGFGEVDAGLPDELSIEFTGVDYFKVNGRDTAQPYPHDEFVVKLGFADDESGAALKPQADATHRNLHIIFASGLGFQFVAESASLKTVSKF